MSPAAATTKKRAKRPAGPAKRRFLVALPEKLADHLDKRAFATKRRERRPYFRNHEVEFLIRKGLDAVGDPPAA